ncbi:MAG: hypothetical protein WC241_04120 [Candidatus Paceibacterota bacterium]|jgi:hypothetical protein
MDAKWAFIAMVGELVLKYGVPAAMQIVGQWKLDHEPTLEEIMALKAQVAHPSTVLTAPGE